MGQPTKMAEGEARTARHKQEKHIQAREDWHTRAVLLMLRSPSLFVIMLCSDWRTYGGQRVRALELVGGGPPTGYRMQLLARACRAWHNEMRRSRGAPEVQAAAALAQHPDP